MTKTVNALRERFFRMVEELWKRNRTVRSDVIEGEVSADAFLPAIRIAAMPNVLDFYRRAIGNPVDDPVVARPEFPVSLPVAIQPVS